MSLSGLALMLLLAVGCIGALRHPYIGVMTWVLFSVMNPHRLTWGSGYSFQFAQYAAFATLLGALISRDPKSIKGGAPAVVLIVLLLWAALNVPFAFFPSAAFNDLVFNLKTMLMLAVMLLVLDSRRHVHLLLGMLVLSLGFYGTKGGLFVLATGGNYMVNGPPDSVMAGNNSLGVGLVFVIPLMYYFYATVRQKYLRIGLLAAMLLCAVSVLGSYSRGALLAVSAMGVLLWLRSSHKMVVAIAAGAFILVAVPFMPDQWTARMHTINDYQEDSSAMFRLYAWETAYNIAKDRFPLGGGFSWISPRVSAQYSPQPDLVMVPHSIYFQVIGALGFVGLGLYLLFWWLVWRQCAWMRKAGRRQPELAWAQVLGSMIQVSLIGYLVGGAFLDLAFWDLPYYLYAVTAVAKKVAERSVAAPIDKQPGSSSLAVAPARALRS